MTRDEYVEAIMERLNPSPHLQLGIRSIVELTVDTLLELQEGTKEYHLYLKDGRLIEISTTQGYDITLKELGLHRRDIARVIVKHNVDSEWP